MTIGSVFLGVPVGSLNTPIEIQENKTTTDKDGFRCDSWETVKKTRCTAQYYPRYLRENFEDEGDTTTQYKVFTFRFWEGINSKQRIIYRKIPYEIVGYTDFMDARRFTQVYARQICL